MVNHAEICSPPIVSRKAVLSTFSLLTSDTHLLKHWELWYHYLLYRWQLASFAGHFLWGCGSFHSDCTPSQCGWWSQDKPCRTTCHHHSGISHSRWHHWYRLPCSNVGNRGRHHATVPHSIPRTREFRWRLRDSSQARSSTLFPVSRQACASTTPSQSGWHTGTAFRRQGL